MEDTKNVANKKGGYFLKFKKSITIFILSFLLILPLNVYAYTKNLIPGGETVGIEVNSNGVLVVGFYKVNDNYLAKEAGFSVGDKILAINQKEVSTIDEMVKEVNKNKEQDAISIEISRENKNLTLSLPIVKDENQIFKTGLYVKDSITGLGTLTYIDPETKTFGALGHEILEKTTAKKFEIKDGEIFKADVVGITKSESGSPGEKNATYYKNEVYGSIDKNLKSGIFGIYEKTLPNKEPLEVATPEEVKTGTASIYTVSSDNTVKEYEITILKVNPLEEVKNILFEITDQDLLSETGGVVQGMSGSPILQNHKIIGAVTHVIVNDAKRGYGIFITKMLEDSESENQSN